MTTEASAWAVARANALVTDMVLDTSGQRLRPRFRDAVALALDEARADERERAAIEPLSHDDICFLSRKFTEITGLWTAQESRCNEWLKEHIARTALKARQP